MKEGIVEILDDWFFSRITDLHTCIPAKIVKYSGHKERKANIELQIKYKTKDRRILTYPVIENVPVMFPSSSDFNLLFPLKKGDGCLALFSETGIGTYLDAGGVSDSDSADRFSLSDAICVPGLWAFNSTPDPPENDTDFWLNYKDFSFTSDGKDFIIKGEKDTIEAENGTVTINGNLEIDT